MGEYPVGPQLDTRLLICGHLLFGGIIPPVQYRLTGESTRRDS